MTSTWIGETKKSARNLVDISGSSDPVEAPLEPSQPVPDLIRAMPLVVTGQVLAGGSQEPLSQVSVSLATKRASALVQTDSTGRFRLSLDAELWTLGSTVSLGISGQDQVFLFRGTVVLETEMLLYARHHFRLHGRLITGLNPVQDPIHLHARVPQSAAVAVDMFAGRDQVAADGTFELQAWVDRRPASFLLLFGTRNGFFLRVEVPTDELTSGQGATIHCQIAGLELKVIDSHLEALEGAQVRIVSDAIDSPDVWSTATTDSDGMATFLLPGGALELCVGKPGYSFGHRFLTLDPQLAVQHQEIRLNALGPSDTVAVRVLDADGQPVEDAYVSAGPNTRQREISVAAFVGVRSDAEGQALLAIDGELPIKVTAYRKDLGMAAPTVLQPGQRSAVLRFDALGSLSVNLTGVPTDRGVHEERIEWIVVLQGDGGTRSGHGSRNPFVIDELPLGDHVVHVLLRRSERLGETPVLIRAGIEAAATVPMDPTTLVSGTLQASNGKPAGSHILNPIDSKLPAPLRELWGTVLTSLDGTFQILLPGPGPQAVRVTDSLGNLAGDLVLRPGTAVYRLP